MDPPLVSILIPFRNTEAFLTECLQSIIEQQYRNWEVIAVDDHSTDGSWQILEVFVTLDHRFRVLKNKGQGIISGLQTAYANSTGSFITRMDSDDIMPVNKLKVLATSLLEYGKGHLAVGKVRYFSIRGISNGYARYEDWLNKLTEKGANYLDIYKECCIPSPCWLAFRQDLDVCGAFMGDQYPEDYDLCFRFYEKKLRIIPCSEVLHYWRDYDRRTSRTSEHYAQNYFLDIKLRYFLKLDWDTERPLAIWGAGSKGKTIAAKLLERNIPFDWLCDNPNKIGKKIYGIPMKHYTSLANFPNAQSIVTVANNQSQKAIRRYLSALEKQPMRDYFFFC